MKLKSVIPLLLFGAILLNSSCSKYEIQVNDNVVYSPTRLFRDYQFADAALFDCVTQNIEEQSIHKAQQLQKLFCPPGEIRDLSGLEIFPNLQQLGLADNRVTDLAPIEALANLEQIDLSNNSVVDASVLGSLKELKVLKLEGNKRLDCSTLDSVKSVATLTSPEHCE